MKQSHQSVTKFLKQSQKTILLMILAVFATLLFSTLISAWLTKTNDSYFPSFATIKTLGVKAFWDADLKNETAGIQWYKVYPGTSNNVTLYLLSVSSIKTRLELQTTNWTFLNSNNTIVLGPVNGTSYVNLKWDYNNATIKPGQTVKVTLTLSIDKSDDFIWFLVNNAVNAFTFDIRIRTTEHD